MSQRMEFEESNRQQQEPPFDSYQSGYRDPFAGTLGQKISSSSSSGGMPAGFRLALAIVSLGILIPIVGIVFGTSAGNGFLGLVGALIGLGLICITIIVVNIAFNFRR